MTQIKTKTNQTETSKQQQKTTDQKQLFLHVSSSSPYLQKISCWEEDVGRKSKWPPPSTPWHNMNRQSSCPRPWTGRKKKNTLSRKIHSQKNTLSRKIHSQEEYTLKKNTLVCNFFHASARCFQHKQIYRPKVVVVDVVDRFPWLSSRLTALLSYAVLNGE